MADAVFHIGLPKTASTWLQRRVWPAMSGYRYAGCAKARDPGLGGMRTWEAFWREPAIWRSHHPRLTRRFLDLVDDSDEPGNVIVSQEKMAAPKVFVPWAGGERSSPEDFGEHLAECRRCIEDVGFDRFRVIGVFRRQDTWYASRYVQSSNRIVGACQEHFQAAVRQIVGPEYDRFGAYADYHRLRRLLVAALGGDNVLLLPYEQLVTEPRVFLQRVLDFLGSSDQAQGFLDSDVGQAGANVRRLGGQAWKLRPAYRSFQLRPERLRKILGLPKKIPASRNRNARQIELTPALSHEILAVYEASNRRLARELDLSLDTYGYFEDRDATGAQ